MNSEHTGESVEEVAALPSNDEQESNTEQSRSEEMVPLSALQSERKRRQEAQQSSRIMQDHLELLRAGQNSRPQQKQEDEFGSLQDEDVLTVGEAKKYLSRLQNYYQMSVEELKMQQTYPDYGDTVRNYLPDVIKENPDLREELDNARNPYKLAYTLAKNSEKYIKDKNKNRKSEAAERIIENSKRPGSLSAVGGTSPKSTMSNWKSMNDKDFLAQVNKHLGYG